MRTLTRGPHSVRYKGSWLYTKSWFDWQGDLLPHCIDESDDGAHTAKHRIDQWQSGKKGTESRVQSFQHAFALSFLNLPNI